RPVRLSLHLDGRPEGEVGTGREEGGPSIAVWRGSRHVDDGCTDHQGPAGTDVDVTAEAAAVAAAVAAQPERSPERDRPGAADRPRAAVTPSAQGLELHVPGRGDVSCQRAEGESSAPAEAPVDIDRSGEVHVGGRIELDVAADAIAVAERQDVAGR